MAVQLILKNSSVEDKKPTPSQLTNGELSLNYSSAGAFLCCTDTDGNTQQVGGVKIAETAPDAPVKQSLWFQPSTLTLSVFDGNNWLQIANPINAPDATETVKGIAELATQAEVTAGTDDQRIVTPAKLKAYVATNAPAPPDATETVKGIVELATAAETTTGTDNTRAVHPAGLKVELDKKAPLASPALTGVPTAPTAAPGTNTTQIATTAFVAASTPADATESVKGIAELATQTEVDTGTDDQRIVTPLKLATAIPAASETAAGKVELATAAETTTGTDNTRAVHPAGLKVELDKKVDLAGDTMTGDLNLPNLVATGDVQSTSQNGGQLAGFRNLIINGNLAINQRAVNIVTTPIGTYGQDRWKKTAGGMTQIIEAGNFEPGATYTLSGTGVTTQQLTAPASGDWTLPDIPVTARKIQLELGPVATPFEHRPVGTELALCQRYFQRITNNPAGGVSNPEWVGYRGVSFTWSGAVVNHSNIHVPLFTPIRTATPTVSINGSRVKDIYNGGDNFTAQNPYGAGGGSMQTSNFIGFAYNDLPSNYVIDFNYVDVDAEL